MGEMKRWPYRAFPWTVGGERLIVDEDNYTEEEQFADWVDKMIRAEEAGA